MSILLFIILGGAFWFYFLQPKSLSVEEIEDDLRFWKNLEK